MMNAVFPETMKTDCMDHTFRVFTSPPHSSVSIDNCALIELGNGGIKFMNTGWRLEYLSPMYLHHISPIEGSVLGGFKVNIVGIF